MGGSGGCTEPYAFQGANASISAIPGSSERGNGLLRGLERAQLGGNQIMNRRIGQPAEVSPAFEQG